MADQDRKILLDIQLNSDQALKASVELKARLADLKAQQAAVNTTTQDGKIQFAAYQAQITNLTKESRSLENSLAQTAGTFNFEAGSIAANRAELSKLTAEYKNLANPTKDQTKTINDLSEKLKKQEEAIGNTSRNVGNYTKSIQAAGLGNTALGQSISSAQEGFGKLKSGLDLAKTGFTTLKGAIASTGIGLLVIAFAALFDWFKKTDEGATALEGIMKAIGLVTEVLTSGVIKLGKFLYSAFTEPKQFIKDLGQILEDQIINRFKALGVLGGAVVKILTGDFKSGLKDLADGAIQLNTGITNATDKMAAFGKEIGNAAIEGYNLAKAYDALSDAQRNFQVLSAEQQRDIDVLLLKLKNKTNSEQESYDIAAKAGKIETENFNQKKAFAEQNLALIKRENDTIRAQRELTDEEEQKEVDAQTKIIDLERESLVVRERIANRIDALQQKYDAQRKSASDKAQKDLEDQAKRDEEYYNKRRALVAQADKEENDRTTFRLSQDVKNASEKISYQQTQASLLLANDQLTSDQKIKIAKDNEAKLEELIDARVKAETDEANQLAAIQSEAGVNTLLIEQQRSQKIIDIHKKAANEKDQIERQTTESVKKQADAQQKIDEIRQKNALALASQSAGSLASLFKENTIAFRVLASVQALIDAFRAANAALASGSEINPIFGAVAAGSTLALGLANVAKINGVAGFRDGIIDLQGPGSGTSDSIPANLSRGESVMTARETTMFRPQLMQMRAIATGYASGVIGINDGGIGQRQIGQPILNDINSRNAQIQLLESMPDNVVLVKDINTALSKSAKVKDTATI
jgi:hypothetical protein